MKGLISFPRILTLLAGDRASPWPHKCVVKLVGPQGWSVQLTGALKIDKGLSDGGAVTYNIVSNRHTSEWCCKDGC